MDVMMKIESDLNHRDYKAFGRAAQRRLIRRKPILSLFRLVLFALILAPAIGMVLPAEGLLFVFIRFGGPFLIVGIGLGVAYMLAISSAVRPAPSGRILERKSMMLDEHGIRVEGQHHETFTRWGGVHEVVETSAHWFLFVDNIQGVVIPKRELADSEALEQLRETIQRGTSQERGFPQGAA